MKKINLIYGTVYGSAQYVAETLEQELATKGYETQLWLTDDLEQAPLPVDEVLLVVSATTGEGDLPDDIEPWYDNLRETEPALQSLEYGIIAMGDSNYDTFCGAGKKIDALLTQLGASRLGERLEIDANETMEPEVPALQWLSDWLPRL